MDHAQPRVSARLARREYRFGLVLLLLLATFVVMMTGSTSTRVRPITVGLTGTTLLASLSAADVSRRLRRTAGFAVVIALVASMSLVGFGRETGGWTTALLNAALVLIAPFAIVRSVIRRPIVDVRTILAALCIYVLFGMLWAFVYTAIGNLATSPFFAQPLEPTSADYLYFSFITELTVGYGDLTASDNLGRSGAVLEALLGQIYLVTVVAVLVSRLVPRPAGDSPSNNH